MLTQLLVALGVATIINILVFFLAFRLQSDKLTDITYSLTFIVLVTYCLIQSDNLQTVQLITFALVVIWAMRLGGFLLYRIYKMGRDRRFDQIRINFWRFFRFFLIQGIGAWLIALPAMFLIMNYPESVLPVSTVVLAGWAIATIGLLLEVVADGQKSAFKSRDGNANKLFTGGLYQYMQFPNYTGEILFWVGIFISSLPILQGFDWLAIISPVTIIVLLVFVSGIPYLEAGREKQYGENADYQVYKTNTARLIPFIY